MAISSVGVVGAGMMGVGIAQITASAGMPVTLIDVSEDVVARAVDGLRAELARRVQQGELAEPDQAAVLASIRGSAAIEALANVDLVVEVVPDNHDLKTALLSRINSLVKPQTIIASGTSSISITRLAASISHPDRFIGMHFFTPVQRIGLVEIVRGLQTSDATHDAVEAFLFQLGNSPITVKSDPGFLVNRILLPMINEAFFVLAEGEATATDIDQGMMLGYEHPIGPLALADTIGLDVLLSVMQAIYEGFADLKYRPCPLLKEWWPPVISVANGAEASIAIDRFTKTHRSLPNLPRLLLASAESGKAGWRSSVEDPMAKLQFDPVTYQFYYRCRPGDGMSKRAAGFRWDPSDAAAIPRIRWRRQRWPPTATVTSGNCSRTCSRRRRPVKRKRHSSSPRLAADCRPRRRRAEHDPVTHERGTAWSFSHDQPTSEYKLGLPMLPCAVACQSDGLGRCRRPREPAAGQRPPVLCRSAVNDAGRRGARTRRTIREIGSRGGYGVRRAAGWPELRPAGTGRANSRRSSNGSFWLQPLYCPIYADRFTATPASN